VITPSHNPPEYGGIKYDPPSGGPAASTVTDWIQDRANALLEGGLRDLTRMPWARARRADSVHSFDYRDAYVGDLPQVLDMDVLQHSGLHVGVDPLGGASLHYWEDIAERYGIHLSIVNRTIDPTFRFVPVDKDGAIRMDPASPYAMARLIDLRAGFDLAFANDPDADRFAIVTHEGGLLEPNQYLAASVWYLFRHRPEWSSTATVGKSIVTSSVIDRVAERLGRRLFEVPVGFKHFVDGLVVGSIGIAGEESAGASFLRRDGTVWTTDKDGFIMALLAIESTARTGLDPRAQYATLAAELGESDYARADFPATPDEKTALARLSVGDVGVTSLAGDAIQQVLTVASGNQQPIGGVKVVTEHGWFAVRPSGTEAMYKLYAESFRNSAHLVRIQDDARAIIRAALVSGARDP
jgi:phosphoglucomutase